MSRRRGDHRVARHLELPRCWRTVNDYLQNHDPDLRVRASVERPGWYVLERKVRRSAAANTAMHERTDIHVQVRDGYIHISIVHPEWLTKPWNIIAALRDEGADLWRIAANVLEDELEYEEALVRETRRRRRQDDGRAFYRELFDILGRVGNPEGRNERTRFTNPGLVAQAAGG